MHKEESDTKSLGDSVSSGGSSESQESDAGVRGRGFRSGGAWPHELIQTKASAASRSVYSSPVTTPHCSLSCFLRFDWGPLFSIQTAPSEAISVKLRNAMSM